MCELFIEGVLLSCDGENKRGPNCCREHQAQLATTASTSSNSQATTARPLQHNKMKGVSTIIVVLGLISMAFAASCHVKVQAVARPGATWPVSNGGGIAGIYDIYATNDGTHTARRVYFNVVLPAGVDIIQWWQFSRLPPTYEDMPDFFTAGSTYNNAGFVVQQLVGTTFPVVTLSYNTTICPN